MCMHLKERYVFICNFMEGKDKQSPGPEKQYIQTLLWSYVYVESVAMRMCPVKEMRHTISWQNMPGHVSLLSAIGWLMQRVTGS